jgi:phosphoribosylglycinamide formyltransferase 2
MKTFGTPLKPSAVRLLMLGSGELGKEVVIEAMRFGIEVIACDRYADAPAMLVANRSHVFNMRDGAELRRVVEREKPHFIVPEIEAIATDTLVELEKEGWTVIPTARATQLTMDRRGIRKLAAEKLKLPTSPYRFASSLAELEEGAMAVGFPCFIKPTMSSSGHGQSIARKLADLAKSWQYAMEGSRAATGMVIVEGAIRFDYEITQLTVRHAKGFAFCEPVGHIQIDGDYRESWQPHPMSKSALEKARNIAQKVVHELCGRKGRGIFGVELFVKGDKVWFSELSPRPHDTGLVTMATQNMSEMELACAGRSRPADPRDHLPPGRLGADPRRGRSRRSGLHRHRQGARRAGHVGAHLRQARGARASPHGGGHGDRTQREGSARQGKGSGQEDQGDIAALPAR